MKKWLATLLMAVCILTLVGGCGESSSTGDEALKQDSQDNGAARTSNESTVPQTGNVVVRLHDAPSDYALQAVLVTIEGIEVHSAIAEQEQEQAQIHTATGSNSGDANQQQEQAQINSGTGNAGWIPVTISGSRTIDVLMYQDGLEALLGVQEMEAGKYTQVRLTVSEVEVFYTSESGTGVESSIARIPSGQLKFVRPFNILAGGTTVLSFDFDVDRSVNFTGSGDVIVKPVIKLDVYYGPTNGGNETDSGGKGTGNQGNREKRAKGADDADDQGSSNPGSGNQPNNQADNNGKGASAHINSSGSPSYSNNSTAENPGGHKGGLKVHMNDTSSHPEVQAVWVTIEGVTVHQVPAGLEPGSPPGTTGGWLSVALSGTNPFNILEYQDDLGALIARDEMEAGKYTQIRLAISEIEVYYLVDSGTELQTVSVSLPGDDLKFVHLFEINPDEVTVLSFNFDVDRSINFTGSGKVNIKPVIQLDVNEEDNGYENGGEDDEEDFENDGDTEGHGPVQNGTATQSKGKEKDKNSDEGNNSGKGNNSGSSDSSSNGNGSDHGKDSNPGKGNAFGQSTDEPGKPDKPGKPE